MRTIVSALVLCAAGDLSAQTQIPLPAFNNTYSSSAGTRGFWFQAPLPFVIVGLRVPDETQAGVQCVEVNRMPTAPPAFPGTIAPTQLFYASNVASANIIPCAIPVMQGDFIGVLGACGTTTMHNSYGPNGPFASTILGMPATLTRFLTQTNLHTTGGNQLCSQEAAFNVSRIEVYVVPATGYAMATPYGTGCYDRSRSFYELFTSGASFDLSGSAMTAILNANSYIVVPGGGWIPPSTSAQTLALANNAEVTVPLPAPFPTPTGPTNSLVVCSNGYVSAGTGNGVATLPAGPAWCTSVAQRWGTWHDFNPAGGGAVKFQMVSGIAVVTWDGVVDNGSSVPSTWQLQFDTASGFVTWVWQSMSMGANPWLVGYAAAGTSRNLGSIDLSSALLAGAVLTGAVDSAGLALAATGRPRLGTTVGLDTTNLPTGTLLGALVFGFTEITAGIDLGALGASGCNQYVSLDANVLFLPTGASHSLPVPIPSSTSFAGLAFPTQSAAFVPGVNPLGILSSNGLRLLLEVN